MSRNAVSMALIAAITEPLRQKSRDRLYMANTGARYRAVLTNDHLRNAVWVMVPGWHLQPLAEGLAPAGEGVFGTNSTSVAERARTQPCEKAKGVSSSVRSG